MENVRLDWNLEQLSFKSQIFYGQTRQRLSHLATVTRNQGEGHCNLQVTFIKI